MALLESTILVEKVEEVLEGDEDLLQVLLEGLLQGVLEAERDVYVGAERHERSPLRRTQRNGYKPRQLVTRVGTLQLRVPQTRDGKFSTVLFDRYQRSEKALTLALAEAWVQGVSTRKMASITEELIGREVSAGTVSRYAKQLDEQLEEFRTRDLSEQAFPFVSVDARYEKVRRDGRIVDMAVLLATGVAEDGHRQVLGVKVAADENGTLWGEFFEELVERGLRGVVLITSDAHRGIGEARREHFPGVLWQRCQRHFLENALDRVPKRHEDEVTDDLQDLWDETDDGPDGLEEALELRDDLVDKWDGKVPELAEFLDEEAEETLAVMDFPKTFWKRLRTTNGVERVNQEIKRRTRVVRIFPNPASCLRLVLALMAEQHEDWISGRRYLDMTHLEEAFDELPEFVRRQLQGEGPAPPPGAREDGAAQPHTLASGERVAHPGLVEVTETI